MLCSRVLSLFPLYTYLPWCRNLVQFKKVCSIQEGQLLLCWVFTPINIQQVSLPLQGIYFAIISENVHTQIQSICKYCVSCTKNHIRSHYKMIMTKIKKKKKRTCKNKIINSTPIIVITYYSSHISDYLCIFLLCSISVFPYLIEIHQI